MSGQTLAGRSPESQRSERPLISVVIPTFNRAPLACEAIESVIQQVAERIEIIVVDDGSSDGTRGMIEQRFGSNVHLIAQDHLGASAARNLGATAAGAPYITFLDSDDRLLPNWFERIEPTLGDGPDLVFCGAIEEYTGESHRRHVVALPTDLGHASGHVRVKFTAAAYIVATELFIDLGGFDTALPSCQHTDLGFRILGSRHIRAVTVDEPLVLYNRPAEGARIRNDDDAVLAGAEIILDRYGGILGSNPRELANYHGVAGYRCLRLRRRGRATRHLLSAVRHDPWNLRHWRRLAGVAAPDALLQRTMGIR